MTSIARHRPLMLIPLTVIALLVGLLAALAPAAIASADQSGQVLYSPDLHAYPTASAGYPRAIRVDDDGSSNQTMLATFARERHGGPTTLPIYRSTDGGLNWSQISSISSHTPGWSIEAPTLFEVPRTIPGLQRGDLLAAGTAWTVGDYTTQKIEVFKSTDHGQTWQYLSNCTQTAGLPDEWGNGIWEPTFLVTSNGTLACFISDERTTSTTTNNQMIGHYTSTDGGATWSSAITPDVSFPDDNLARPGMQTFAQLPNGQFVMAYEMCRDATDPDHACAVYVRFSPDGLSWGATGSQGTLVQTSDGRQLLHTPYISWMPGGGPDGTLLLSGQRVVSGPTGDKLVLGESGSVIFANTANGTGHWTEVEAPVTVNPTGGYAQGSPSCPGYSTPAIPREDGTSFLYFASTWLGTGNSCEMRFGIGALPGPAGHITGLAGKCVDVDTNTATRGKSVQIYTCNDASGQNWSVSADGTVRAFGKCLDVTSNGTANYSPVQLWDCLPNAGAQQWRPRADGTLFNPQSARCLEVSGGSSSDGTDLRIADCTGQAQQIWALPGQPTGPIVGPGTSGLCVDVDTNTGVSGRAVQVWTCSGVPGQQWTMATDGTIRAFGKCLDITANGTANGSRVQLWDCLPNAGAQQWRPRSDGSLFNPQSGRCLDLPQGDTTRGTDLTIYDCNGLWPQRWKFPV